MIAQKLHRYRSILLMSTIIGHTYYITCLNNMFKNDNIFYAELRIPMSTHNYFFRLFFIYRK